MKSFAVFVFATFGVIPRRVSDAVNSDEKKIAAALCASK